MRKRTSWEGPAHARVPFLPTSLRIFLVRSSATVLPARSGEGPTAPWTGWGPGGASDMPGPPGPARPAADPPEAAHAEPRDRLAVAPSPAQAPPPTLFEGCGGWRWPGLRASERRVLFPRRPRRSEGFGSCKRGPRSGCRARRGRSPNPWGVQQWLLLCRARPLRVQARRRQRCRLSPLWCVLALASPRRCTVNWLSVYTVSATRTAVIRLHPPSPSCSLDELHLGDHQTSKELTLGVTMMASAARFRRLAATASAAGLLFSLVGGVHAAGAKVAPDADLSELLGVGLVVAQLVFHVLLHQLEHFVGHKHPSLLPVLRTLYRELLILGFVSFTFILVATFGKVSDELFVSFEFAHLLIFLLAVFYIFVVFATSWASLSLSARWRKIESMEFVEYLAFKQEYTELKAEREQHHNYVWRWCLWWKGNPFKLERYHFLHERMAFHDSRFQFLYYRGLPEDFSFSAYLRKVKSQVRCRLRRERGVR